MREMLVELEEDLQYINVASSKNKKEHGMIRLVLSCMADAEEISNLTPKDVIEKKLEGVPVHYVYLRKGRRVRRYPIDRRTYLTLRELSASIGKRSKIFDYSEREIDSIIQKYSPKNRKYNLKTLLRAVKTIISDNLLGKSAEDLDSMSSEELIDFMQDFHPMFSGMWDLDRDDVAFDYFQMLSERYGISGYSEMAEISGESVERIEKLMKRKWFQNYMVS